MPPRARRQAFWIAVIYIIVAGGWAIGSDVLLKHFVGNLTRYLEIDMVKDWVFMGLMGVLLYRLVGRLLRHWEEVVEQQKETEKKLRLREQALKTISGCNGALVRATNECDLLNEICRVVVEKGGYRMAWVGFAKGDAEKSVAIAAQAGFDEGYLRESKISWSANLARGCGPTGTALRSGAVVVCNDFQNDPQGAPWRESAVRHGFRSIIVLPLHTGDQAPGALTIYSAQVSAFNAAEVELLKELAADLAYGIQALRTQIERTQAQQAQHLFRALIDRSSDGILVVDPVTGSFLDANESACRSLGYVREELLQMAAFDVAMGLDLALFEANRDEMEKTGWVTRETLHRRKDGSTYPVEITLSPVLVDREYWVVITRDISLRRRTEETLRQSEKKFSGIFHSSPVPVSLSTISDGLYLDVNNEFLAMLERSREEVIGHTAFELEVWAEPHQRAALLKRLESQGTIRNAELKIRTKSGAVRSILWSVVAVVIGGENCWLGSALDVTEQKQAEQRLRESEQRYRQLFDLESDALVLVDCATHRYVDVNQSALELYGYSREEFLERKPEDFSAEPELTRATIGSGHIRVPLRWHRRKSGEVFAVEITANQITVQGRQIELAAIRDITARQRVLEELQETTTRLLEAQRLANLGSYVFDVRTGQWSSSEILDELFGLPEASLTRDSATWLQIIHPEDREEMNRYLREALLEGRQAFDRTYRIVRQCDGQTRWVHGLGKLVRDPQGGVAQMLGTIQDITESKRLEETLRQNELFVRSVLDSLSAHIAVLNEEGVVVAVNEAWRRFVIENGGDPAQTLLGVNYVKVCQVDSSEPAAGTAAAACAGLCSVMSGEQSSFQLEYPCHSATAQRWFMMHVWPHGGAGGGVVVSHENITARKQTEQLLGFVAQEGWSQPQENYLVRLAEYLGRTMAVDYVFIGQRKDEQTIQTTGFYAKGQIVPDIEYSIQGGPCHHVIGQQFRHYGQDLPALFPGASLLSKIAAQSYLGIPLTDSTGRPIGLLALLHSRPMPEAQPAAAMLQIAAVRVAGEIERRARVEELRWKTALMEAQMEAAPDGVLMIDNNGRRVLQNQRMNDLLKIPPHIYENEDDSVQVDYFVSRTKFPAQTRARIAHLYAHPDEVARDEIELVDGTIVDRFSAPVRDKRGGSCGRIWTFRDVTRSRLLEAQLRQSQKMEAIGVLAGGVAHDFNNILCALLMQTALIEMTKGLPDEVRQGLAQIRVDANRAAELTRQLLLFSRRQVMQTCVLDVNDVVINLAKMLQRIIGEDVRLQMQLHTSPLLIRADAGMMDQILMNLVVNARDAMPRGGRIRIETREKIVDENNVGLYAEAVPGHYACLVVTDTGTGIPADVLAHIFEPFFTTKGAGKGTGLGLSTVFGIVQQHHGWINVENLPGRGATFEIFLPLSESAAAIAVPAAAQPHPLGGHETILLVEDEVIVRKLIRSSLEQRGYSVLAATNGTQAMHLWLLHGKNVALLLTDLVMPGGLGGHELARHLQAADAKLKVVYISGYSAEIGGHELQLRPGENFLQKPFTAEQLLETIRRSLDG